MIETTPVSPRASTKPPSPFQQWLLKGYLPEMEGPHERKGAHHEHSWWQVMCLTGVDYFSTLGYQPGIAALAAGALSPAATLVLVLLTLFGAFPIYKRVAQESPHGEGSISMLANLLSAWRGKLFVLILLGFVATDFVITMTLSAADAAAHVVENPLVHAWADGHHVGITLTLLALLGAVFLKGFKEAIGIAVVLVGIYLVLNAVVLGYGTYVALTHPSHFTDWRQAIFAGPTQGSPLRVIGLSLLLFPKLALGLSGFETGVAVMPLVKGEPGDTEEKPTGRIHNTRKLLISAALIMSVFLILSSLVTTLLIPPAAFQKGGDANGRALAYLAHELMGNGFGTVYDVSTIAILWFAGASAMAGLLNIVPRYLPRYGMAPEWTRATRPLVVVFTVIAFVVTFIFKADVDAQGGAYATGVLVLMTSAAVAVTLSVKRAAGKGKGRVAAAAYGLIALVFCYTTIVNIIERPDGVKIAAFFIGAIVLVSFVSRLARTTELRATHIEFDDLAQQFIDDAAKHGPIQVVANHPDARDVTEYQEKAAAARQHNNIHSDDPLLFLEVYIDDHSDFTGVLRVCGSEVAGHRILRAQGVAIPNAIAAILLYLRDYTGELPHAYFSWTEGSPFVFAIKYILLGQGDVAPVTHEVLRVAEPDPTRRPEVHVAF